MLTFLESVLSYSQEPFGPKKTSEVQALPHVNCPASGTPSFKDVKFVLPQPYEYI
jgi:hypothetical protein